MVSTNTNAAAIMIGEKGADLVISARQGGVSEAAPQRSKEASEIGL
jgi:hypothetical protein